MKTMKYILLILCVSVATSVLAVDFKLHQTGSFKSTSSVQFYSGSNVGAAIAYTTVASVPVVEFRSTSTMPSVGSNLSAASSMEVSIDEGGNTQTPSGPKRVNPNRPPTDPFEDPLGDAVLPLLLLAAGYVFFIARKRRDCAERN